MSSRLSRITTRKSKLFTESDEPSRWLDKYVYFANKYCRAVLRNFRMLSRRQDEAEDLAQEFFAHALEMEFLPKAGKAISHTDRSFRPYLKASLRNFWREQARKNAMSRSLPLEEDALATIPAPDELQPMVEREHAQHLLECIRTKFMKDAGPEDRKLARALLELRFHNGSRKEIACRLGMSPDQLHEQLRRVMTLLGRVVFSQLTEFRARLKGEGGKH